MQLNTTQEFQGWSHKENFIFWNLSNMFGHFNWNPVSVGDEII